jgi:hypothetical protein
VPRIESRRCRLEWLNLVDELPCERERSRGRQCYESDGQDSKRHAQARACDQRGVQPQQRFGQPEHIEQREVDDQHGGESGNGLSRAPLPRVQPVDDVDRC